MILSEFLRLPLSPEEEKLVCFEYFFHAALGSFFTEPLRSRMRLAEASLGSLGAEPASMLCRAVLQRAIDPRVQPEPRGRAETELLLNDCLKCRPRRQWLASGNAEREPRWCLILEGEGGSQAAVTPVEPVDLRSFLDGFLPQLVERFPKSTYQTVRYLEPPPLPLQFKCRTEAPLVAWIQRVEGAQKDRVTPIVPEHLIRVCLIQSVDQSELLLARACGFEWELALEAGGGGYLVQSGGVMRKESGVEKTREEEARVQPELVLGYLEMSLADFLSIRPGDLIETAVPERIQAMIRVGGVEWLSAECTVRDGSLQLEAKELAGAS